NVCQVCVASSVKSKKSPPDEPAIRAPWLGCPAIGTNSIVVRLPKASVKREPPGTRLPVKSVQEDASGPVVTDPAQMRLGAAVYRFCQWAVPMVPSRIAKLPDDAPAAALSAVSTLTGVWAAAGAGRKKS